MLRFDGQLVRLRDRFDALKAMSKSYPTLRMYVAALMLLLPLYSSAQPMEPTPAQAEKTDKESPWLLTPLVSSEPKLGATLGGLGAYLKRFDPGSTQSMMGLYGTYSDTESWVLAAFGDIYLQDNKHKIVVGAVSGRINNEYDDFLGIGLPARTTDDLGAYFLRYSYQIRPNWYLGGQAISSNYAIGADGLMGSFLELIGLTGFDSVGVGAVAEYDTRDRQRDPSSGNKFVANNIAYRESLGGDESFDVVSAEYQHYFQPLERMVLAMQVKGRWTDDAPLGGYSSASLRGYVVGNYIAPNWSHVDFDARYMVGSRWGVVGFAGVGCLYGGNSSCRYSDDIYPSVGAGFMYKLKQEAGIVIRAEAAFGKDDNKGFYLRLGHPF